MEADSAGITEADSADITAGILDIIIMDTITGVIQVMATDMEDMEDMEDMVHRFWVDSSAV